MEKFNCSYLNLFVELTYERKIHIQTYHPDLSKYFGKISEILLTPDEVRQSIYDKEVIIFYKYFSEIKNGKFISVVVKTGIRNFILTSYLTDKIKGGEVLWKKV